MSRDDSGAVAVITIFAMATLMVCAALAIDVGSVFLAARKLQGMADLAALAAANNLTDATAAAQATANDNGWDGPVTAVVATGQYQALSTIAPANRFQANAANINAVKVTLTANADLFFAAQLLGVSSWRLTRTATASQADLASFSIGSRLLAIQGGVENSILSALTGSQVSLSAVDYNALASANVDLLSYAQALQTQMNLKGVSFNTVLSGSISTGGALSALASVLDAQNATAAAAVRNLATAAGATTPVNLSQLLNLGAYGDQDHGLDVPGTAIQIDAMDLTNAMLLLASGGRQVQLNLAGTIPGVSAITAWLAMGQRPSNSPWLAVQDDGGTTIYTVQARVYLEVEIAPGAGVLSSAGIAEVNLPILIDAASAEAKLSTMNCSGGASNQSANLLVAPSIGHASIARIDTSQLNNFTQPLTESPATLAAVPSLLSITGQALVDVGGLNWQTVAFSQSDIQAQTVKTVATDDITQAVVTSLLGSLNTKVQVLGLGIGVGAGPLTGALQSTLSTVAPSLDSLINALTATLGIGLGEADVRMNGLRCGQAALVA